MFKGPEVVQERPHKDPGKATVDLEPSEDQAGISPREFCKAVEPHGRKGIIGRKTFRNILLQIYYRP